jgi:hypothetical protein
MNAKLFAETKDQNNATSWLACHYTIVTLAPNTST